MPFSALPDDVLRHIAGLLWIESPTSLLAIGLASKRLFSIAQYAKLQHVTLRTSVGKNAPWRERLAKIKDAGLLQAIRQLTVLEAKPMERPPGTVCNRDIQAICEVLPSMTGLRDVYYKGDSPPRQLLATLRATSRVRLHTQIDFQAEPHQSASLRGETLAELQGNPNLTSLKVKIEFFEAAGCIERMRQLKSVLLSCLSLKYLDLDVAQPTGIGVRLNTPPEYCGLGFAHGEKLPALEGLILTNYPFHSGRPHVAGTESDHGIDPPGTETEIDYWVNTFDWSRLKRLATRSNDFAEQLMPRLTSLQEMTHLDQWLDQDLSRFYLHIPSLLTSISVPTLKSITLGGILHHGGTLEALHIHQPESYYFQWRDYAMDIDSLRAIQQNCTNMAELSLDIARDGMWPHDMFEALAQFGRLRILHVWLELGANSSTGPVEPLVTMSAAEEMYRMIRSRARGISQLEQLVVHSGAPPPRPSGNLASAAFWCEQNSLTFVYKMAERDDQAAQGEISGMCKELQQLQEQIETLKNDSQTQDRAGTDHKRTRLQGLKKTLAKLKRHQDSKPTRMNGLEESRRKMWRLAYEGPMPFGH